MGRVRVLQVLDSLAMGGAQRMAVHLARSLDLGRFDVRIASMFDRKGTDLEEILEGGGHVVTYHGKRLGFDPVVAFRLDRVIQRFRPHVAHTHVGALRYTLASVLLRRIPVAVHTLHSLAEREAAFPLVNRIAIQLGIHFVAIADEVAASAKRFYGVDDVSNIPNGIPVEFYRSPIVGRKAWRSREGFAESDVFFVNVARLDPPKNQLLLIRAFAPIAAADARTRLLLAGDGPLASMLQAEVESLGLERRVHFLGVRTDIPELLSASDVFVLSSDWEGNPLTVMEAMAAGLPVVSTAVGGVPQLVEDGRTGLLTRRGDTKDLSRAMLRLLTDADLAADLGRQAGLRAIEEFDVSAMADAYGRLYESLLARRRRGSRRE